MVSSVICASSGGDAIGTSFNRQIADQHGVQGIFFVFDKEEMPDIGAIRAFAEAARNTFISIERHRGAMNKPVLATGDALDNLSEPHSLSVQLLHGGLTFDLGFPTDGQDDALPSNLINFDCDWPVEAGFSGVLQLRPGYHIGSGANSLPIMRSFMELARDFVLHFKQISAIIWPPANSVIGRRYFDSSISAWLERGIFPPRGLVAFQEATNGEFCSLGLDFFVGQELRIAAGLMDDTASPGGLSARLVNQLVLSGPATEQQELIAPNGRRVSLIPAEEGKVLLVR